jgi:hypothetical protein
MMTFRQIIDLWPTMSALATDVGLHDKYQTVAAWKRRDRIPPDYWIAVVRAAKRRDLPVTYETLASAAAKTAA